jgi:hypothetical protein
MDLSEFPEVTDFDGAVAKVEALQAEGEELQKRLAQITGEIVYYQGAAKALEPKEDE